MKKMLPGFLSERNENYELVVTYPGYLLLRRRWLILALFLTFFSKSQNSFSQELTADANTLLLLNFNNSITGAAGEMPASSANVSYDAGRFGQALKCNGNTVLRFDTVGNLNRHTGTIEFWIKPDNFTGAGYILDYGWVTGMLLEIGFFSGFQINKVPEIYVNMPGTAWFPNTWYHLAFTWGNGLLKMYLNGRLEKTTTYAVSLTPIALTQFSVAAPAGGSGGYKGLVDEFRISNTARSDAEICNTYLQGAGTIQSLSSNITQITLFKGWNVYLSKADTYQSPVITASINGVNTTIGNGCLNWMVSDPNIIQFNSATQTLTAINAGSATLTGSFGNISVSISVTVHAPFLPEEHITLSNDFLTSPASCHTRKIPVAMLIYLPTDNGITLNTTYGGTTFTDVQKLKTHCLNIARFAKFSLEEGSKFRGYSNSGANPYLGYEIVEYIIVYEPPPLCFLKRPNVYQPDYNQIMARHRGKRLVDTLGVREIWMFSGDWAIAEGDESNMSSPTTGDISNSLRRNDDLPVYDNTYILYNYSFQRGGNEAVHNHGHQLESMLAHAATLQDGNAGLFWRDFVGRSGINFSNPPLGRCGDTHHPPNTTVDYDYCNPSLVASDIFDWKPSGGQTTLVNCQTWNTLPYTWPPITISGLGCCDAGELPDHNSRFFVLWMQSFPGAGNQIPHGGRWMTNWWRFLSDWDSNTVKIGLHQQSQEPVLPCNTAITASLLGTAFCAGETTQVTYTALNATFNSGNIFTVQLSDASGSFSNPVPIGTLAGTASSGVISVVIPPGAVTGNMYSLRVNSSNLLLTGTTSAFFLVTATPPAPVVSGSPTTICTGNSVLLTSNAPSGNQWYKDGTLLNGFTDNTLNVTSGGSYTTRVTLAGCESPVSNAIVVTVNPIPPAPVISAGGPLSFCAGGNVTLSSDAPTGNQWYKDGNLLPGSTSTTLLVTSSGLYTSRVTQNGCESAASNGITVTVIAAPAPPTCPANIAGICTGTAAFALTGASPSGGTFSGPGVNVGSFDPSMAGPGTHTITYSIGAGDCTVTCTFTINVVEVTGNISGTTTATQNAATSSAVTFSAAGGAANYTFSYTVSVNGGPAGAPQTVSTAGGSGTVVVQQSNAVAGTYTYTLVSVTDNNGCSGTPTPPASITVTVVPPGGTPDLTSSQFYTSLQLSPGQVIDELIALRNVGNGATSGPVSLSITNYNPLTGLSVTLNNAPSVTIGFTTYPLDNTNWSFSSATGVLNSTAPIPAGAVRYLGIRISRNPAPGQGANGQVTQTTTVQPGTGGNESPTNNNSISNNLLKNL